MQHLVADRAGTAAQFKRILTWRWGLVALCLAALVPLSTAGTLSGDRYPAYISAVIFIVFVNVVSDRILRHKAALGSGDVAIQVLLDVANVFAVLTVVGASGYVYAAVFAAFSLVATLALRGPLRGALTGVLVLAAVGAFALARRYDAWSLSPVVLRAYCLLVAHFCIALLLWFLVAWVAKAVPNLRRQRARIDGLRGLGAIAAGVSHELATPLSTIKVRLERIARRHGDDDSEAALEALARCEQVLRRLAATKLDAESMTPRTVTLRGLLDEVCAGWLQDVSAPSRSLTVIGGETARCSVPPLAISQVFLSLLDNAFEASPRGAAIDVEVDPHGEQIVVAFKDRGPGIPKGVRRHFGEPFVTTKAQGTGLGLYNALTLAQALGGDLTLADRDGGGAIVALSLPHAT